MRFFEFSVFDDVDTDSGLDKFIMMLRNEIGNYARKRAPAKLNWAHIAQLSQKAGFEFLGDPKDGYETFKSIYDSTPAIQAMVKDFNDEGVELKVPGAPDEKNPPGAQDSQAAVDQTADSAAAGQLAQSQQTPQVQA
jgi:hypothetical protein